MCRNTKSSPSAFTLVELLVVVSIIALLIAILLPSLKRARDQTKKVVCASRLKQISTALWSYMTESNGRVPYVVSPMTDGESSGDLATDGLGDPSVPDEELNPFNRNPAATEDEPKGWPFSLPNVLMPSYVGSDESIFVCPAAVYGWPRNGKPYRMTYRPAAINQPTGVMPEPGAAAADQLGADQYYYDREFFGFLDGRTFRPPDPVKHTGSDMTSVIREAHRAAFLRGVYVRDMARRVVKAGGKTEFIGPHDGGMNVINKRLDVEYRDKATTNKDLVPQEASGGLLF